MMKKRLLVLLLLILLMTVLLSGCLQFDIKLGIDEVNNTFLIYTFELDTAGFDPEYREVLANTLNNLGVYYQDEFGFTAGVSADADIYILKLEKIIPNDTFSDAFNTLKAMLTDEYITAFTSVDMTIESFPRQENFIFSATTDFSHVVELSGYEDLPPDLRAAFRQALPASSGALLLTMPVSELMSSTHNVEMQRHIGVMSVPFNFTEPAEFELRAGVVYTKDGNQVVSTEYMQDALTQMRLITIIVASSLLGILIISLLVVLFKRKKRLY